MKIIFAGTPDFSVPPLQALLGSSHEVVAVYTQPDRPAGRGRKLTHSPVKITAEAAELPVYQPAHFKQTADLEVLEAIQADLMVVVAYGLLLPERVLASPRLGCINIHASLLPRWRGAAPIQRAIVANDAETGITIMQMEKGFDTGPMFLIEKTPISPGETGGSLHDRLSVMGADALMQALPEVASGKKTPAPQNDDQSTYAKKLEKAEALINWQQSAVEISRQIRAFNPWPVAHTQYKNTHLRIWQSTVIEGETSSPGVVMTASRHGIDVATANGLLRILQLQMPGKRAMSAAEFINANSIQGATLG